MLYYTITTPTSRALGKEAGKSLGLGIIIGLAYYRIRREDYLSDLHKYYITVIQEKQRRRIARGEREKNE